MIPAGLCHDRRSAVLMRGGRAARLSPVMNLIIAELMEAGGERPLTALALGLRPSSDLLLCRWTGRIRDEIRRAAGNLERLDVAITLDGRRAARFADLSIAERSAA